MFKHGTVVVCYDSNKDPEEYAINLMKTMGFVAPGSSHGDFSVTLPEGPPFFSISPSIALAKYDKGKLTVWSHAQGMYPLRDAIAGVVGLERDNVRCIHAQGCGCYGHNGADDAACDAALLAMLLPGRPIS